MGRRVLSGQLFSCYVIGLGNNWVIAGIIVTLPFVNRPVCLPVVARLVVKNTTSASRLWLARRMVEDLARALPDRAIHSWLMPPTPGVSCAAWASRSPGPPAYVAMPPCSNRAAGHRQPRPTPAQGRPAAVPGHAGRTLAFTPTAVHRYGATTTVHTATVTCLWYSVFGSRPVPVVLLREPGHRGYQLALVSTDTAATPAQTIGRYATRWVDRDRHRRRLERAPGT